MCLAQGLVRTELSKLKHRFSKSLTPPAISREVSEEKWSAGLLSFSHQPLPPGAELRRTLGCPATWAPCPAPGAGGASLFECHTRGLPCLSITEAEVRDTYVSLSLCSKIL